jgi:glycosyltransferase involved in cell wall biosynthesis
MSMLVSIIIRTYNEEKHLEELFDAIERQKNEFFDVEVVIVDSGSTDRTLEIANNFNARITTIKKEAFTFGRSLNIGCDFAKGDFLVFISGHCIPINNHWLGNLIKPLLEGKAAYGYGRQTGHETSKFSEKQVFKKYFPSQSAVPQEGFFCNNANAVLLKTMWFKIPFDEDLTGLEDMFLAKQLVAQGEYVAYIADSEVFHIHEESWEQIKIRYEREAIALQKIMPQVHIEWTDFIRYFFGAVTHDLAVAKKEGLFFNKLFEIMMFRLMQYWGAYKGNHEHRKLSAQEKEKYFYPN